MGVDSQNLSLSFPPKSILPLYGLLISRRAMEYQFYLAPMLALLFFLLVAVATYLCYRLQQMQKSDREVILQEAQLVVVETTKGSHSAVKDYFVVRHL